MEPRIQYARTSDGVSIAYSTLGEGLPLVQAPPIPFSQVQLASNMPEDSRWWDFMSGHIKLIRYDARGTGLSDRDVRDFAADAFVSDLEAVVDQAKLDRLALWAFITSGPVAIEYATRHPERVSHLILWSAWARTADVLRLPQAQGLMALVDKDWGLFAEAASHAFFGWSEGELAHRAAIHLQEGITQETWKRMFDALSDSDVTHLLSQVQAPTLVLHSREAPLPDISVARELASRIPDARLVMLEGPVAGWQVPDEAIGALSDFLDIPAPGTRAAPSPSRSDSPLTLLFTDIEGSTSLTQRLGDTAAHEVLRAHNAIVREALAARGGSEVKHTGDGIMASFPSASRAVECAIAIQQAVDKGSRVAGRGSREALRVRIGINAGEPVREDDDLFGTAVQLARRVCDTARGGEILVTDVVRQLAMGKAFVFSERESTALKGFDEPVRLYRVAWET